MRATMQQQIDEMQTRYHEWLTLHIRLEAAEQDWQRSQIIMRQLNAFYFEGDYRKFYGAIEKGQTLICIPKENTVL